MESLHKDTFLIIVSYVDISTFETLLVVNKKINRLLNTANDLFYRKLCINNGCGLTKAKNLTWKQFCYSTVLVFNKCLYGDYLNMGKILQEIIEKFPNTFYDRVEREFMQDDLRQFSKILIEFAHDIETMHNKSILKRSEYHVVLEKEENMCYNHGHDWYDCDIKFCTQYGCCNCDYSDYNINEYDYSECLCYDRQIDSK